MIKSKWNGTRTRILFLAIASTYLLMFTSIDSALAQAGWTFMPVKYRETENGDTIDTDCRFDDSFYHPTEGDYCEEDHRDPDGSKYEHSHLPHGFGFWHGQRQNWVTEEMSDWAWDAEYTSYTQESGSTFSLNCFAYAEDAPTVMFYEGWDDFTDSCSLQYATSYAESGHAVKIEDVYYHPLYCKYVISYTEEKNASGGVYSHGWLPLGIDPPSGATLGKSK